MATWPCALSPNAVELRGLARLELARASAGVLLCKERRTGIDKRLREGRLDLTVAVQTASYAWERVFPKALEDPPATERSESYAYAVRQRVHGG